LVVKLLLVTFVAEVAVGGGRVGVAVAVGVGVGVGSDRVVTEMTLELALIMAPL